MHSKTTAVDSLFQQLSLLEFKLLLLILNFEVMLFDRYHVNKGSNFCMYALNCRSNFFFFFFFFFGGGGGG